MNQKKSFSVAVFVLLFVIAVVAGFFLTTRLHSSVQKSAEKQASDSLPSYAHVLVDVADWLPDGGWSDPAPSPSETLYGEPSGYETHGQKTSDTASIDHFENVNALAEMGYTVDTNLQADGPGSSQWGYVKETGRKKQVLILSYEVQSTNSNPNEPVQFHCPCDINVRAFVSEPF